SDISAAAAFVYVRQRMRSGGALASNNRVTRLASVCVFPAPALAETHAECFGSAAARTGSCALIPPRPIRWPTIRGPAPDDRNRPKIPAGTASRAADKVALHCRIAPRARSAILLP